MASEQSTGVSNIRRAQTWTCHEANADPDTVPGSHDSVSLWPDYPRFSAVVDCVQDGVAELTVGTSNSHPRAPDLGDRVDVHVDTLLEGDRWSLKSDAVGVEESAEDPPLVTDGGQCAGSSERRQVCRGVAPEEGCENCGRGKCCNCTVKDTTSTGSISSRSEFALHYLCDGCAEAMKNV